MLTAMCLGAAHGQGINVAYFPCEVGDVLDLKHPDLQDELITLGIAVDPAEKDPTLLQQVLDVLREDPVEVEAFAVRITNQSGAAIALTRDNVQLALVSHDDEGKRRVDKRIKAADITKWTGARSLFAKGDQVADKDTARGVVYFELSAEDAQAAALAALEIEYVPEEGDPSPGRVVEGLLEEVGLKWTTPISRAPRAPAGRPRIFPAMGNTDDNTPLRLPAPGEITARPDKAVVAHKNIVAEQVQQQPGMMPGMGQGMPGMPGMMPGAPGMMPGMPGMPGAGAPGMAPGMPGMPGMPGAPGAAPGMPGMPGMPGAPAAAPGMPATPAGTPGVAPGAPTAPGGRRPRRPGGAQPQPEGGA